MLALLPKEDTILSLTDAEADAMWLHLRWPDGKPRCPGCSGIEVYETNRDRYRCKVCRSDFSLTSGTPFAFAKAPMRTILLAISCAQHGNGEKSLLRISQDTGIGYKTFYTLTCKAMEMLAGGPERVSVMRGYMTTNGVRAHAAQFPRVKIVALFRTKTCTECGNQKPNDAFGRRVGVAADWGLTATVCNDCRASHQRIALKKTWQQKKAEDQAFVAVARPASQILARNPQLRGLWSEGANWTAQERADLANLAAAKVNSELASAALMRSPKAIAWKARDFLGFAQMPADWKRLIAPSRIILAPRLLVYPYLPTVTRTHKISGAELTIAVSAIVSRSFPNFMRADICQTVLLAILEGKATLDDMKGSPESLRNLVRAYRRDQEGLPGGSSIQRVGGSLDAPRWGDDDRDYHETAIPAGIMNRLEW